MLDDSQNGFNETEADVEYGFFGESEELNFEHPELAELFDRYATALDAGDYQAAERVLAAHPEIGQEFRTPLRGLYLLGCEARQRKEELGRDDSEVKRLGDFELGEELGRGGMGVVYAARQISLQRDVALKILPFTAVLDPRQVSRFQNEAQAAASLHHPNIVPVYGVGCERGIHYYSMQWIKGQTIAELIKQLRDTREADQTMPHADESANISSLSTVASIHSRSYVRNVASVGAKIAAALHFAHDHGIIHRDIKPSNILLDQSGTPWVADFGLARGRGNANLTSQGDQIGTLRYMSPEQAAGRNHQVDFRTDIYSLGITLYELLTLNRPFDEVDRIKVLNQIQTESLPPMRNANSSIPYDLETIITKATDKSPLQRYDSAEEFADDLNRFLAGKSILARRKSLVERVSDSVARNKTWSIAIASLMVLTTIAAVTAATVFYQLRERQQEATAEAKFYLQQAHKTVDRFNLMLSDKLMTTQGSDALRSEVLEESIGYYRDFLAYSQRQEGFEFERARAHAQLAELYESAGTDSKALVEYEAAIAQLSRLPLRSAKAEKAIALNKLGLLQLRNGDTDGASVSIEASIGSFEQLKDDAAIDIPHAMARANAAKLFMAKGDSGTAADYYAKALDLLSKDSGDRELMLARAKITNGYGSLISQSDPDRGIQFILEAIKTTESSLEASKGDASARTLTENRRHLADMRNNVAILLSRRNRLKEAGLNSQKAIAFWEQQRESNPNSYIVIKRLATALNTKGEIHWRADSVDSADNYFAKAESLMRRALSLRSLPETKSRLAGVLHNRGMVAFADGDQELAAARIREAITLQSQSIQTVPDNQSYRQLLDSHENALDVFMLRTDSPVSAPPGELQ